MYIQLIGQQPRIEWTCFMFKNDPSGKAIFTMWLQFQNRLLTGYRLSSWGMDVWNTCVFCQGHDESRDHLFAECSFSRNVWSRLLMWLHGRPYKAMTWQQHFTWAMRNAKGRTVEARIFRVVYAETIHGVWGERNMRIFQKITKRPEDIARHIAYTCNVRAKIGAKAFLQNCRFWDLMIHQCYREECS